MLVVGIVLAVLLLLVIALGITAAWYFGTPKTADRLSRVRSEAQLSEARIDLLTRSALQQMRDVVRSEQRGHSHTGGRVIDGDVIE